MYFFGPNVALCGSCGDRLTNETVVPTLIGSRFGKYAYMGSALPAPMSPSLCPGFAAAASCFVFAQPAATSESVCAVTCAGDFGTAVPAGLTTTVPVIPG